MITQVGLYCAASALVAAFYLHVIMRLAVVLKRKFHVPTLGLAMLPLIVVTIGLLYLEFLLLQSYVPALTDTIGGSTFLGLAIGRLVPFPGSGFSTRFGIGGDDGFIDDGGDDSDSGGDH